MAASKEHKLFSEFPPVATEQWEEVINADLKGADYAKRLVWRTREGFDVRPYYRAEDLAAVKYIGAGVGEFPYVRSTGKHNRWLVSQTVTVLDPAKARTEAQAAIDGGADAISYRVKMNGFASDDLETLLSGIDLSKTEITLGGKDMHGLAQHVLAWAKRRRLDPMAAHINLMCDPVCSQLTLRGDFPCHTPDGAPCFEQLAGLVKAAAEFKKMRPITVCGHNFGNAGATIVEELAFTLAAGHEYVARLVENGLSGDTAAHALRFSVSISSNYFMEIAKLRAARMLWATIVRQYKPERACSEKMRIHAVGSMWNMTVYDPYVNMLRGTTEAMSAAIGGVYSMEVLPFDAAFEPATEFSGRIARNVQLLLKHEAHFDNVTDPSGGSYYIETLTQQIAEQAWALFKEVEDMGGYIKAFRAGFVQKRIGASAAAKDGDVATRRIVLLGTNQYPNFNEVADSAVSESTVARSTCHCGCADCCCSSASGCGCTECNCNCGECNCPMNSGSERLHLLRGAQPFEQMRLAVDRSGREPKVFMLTVGTLGMARARAQFASNFFACAGFRIEDNTFFKSVEEGVAAAVAAKADIVVVCAADDDYATLAPQAFEQLGGRAVFVVAGAPGSQPELEARGITNFINVRSNVLTTLEKYVKELGL
ncbi:MAG: methylmalonyl-CoA mutase family protein [Rikenellaceae bacterium]|nr:methylmalonyl-CoA mutase family protein [Rikenellaceae bacterium]MCL2693403.1 methylmalonyl-CoA mutase family protein [Rikenellaceae bacterium]